MEEKRKQERLRTADYFRLKKEYLRQFFTVFDRMTGQTIGHVVDISTGGIMLISPDPIKEGSILRLRIEMPQKIDGSGRLTVDARTVWCKKEENPDCYYAGFEFTQISPEQVKIIESLIRQYMTADVY